MMTTHVADHPTLRMVQAALKAMLGSGVDKNADADVCHSEAQRREMFCAGDLLIVALRREQEFSKVNFIHAGYDVLEAWRASRRTVDERAAQYSEAVANWRESVQKSVRCW